MPITDDELTVIRQLDEVKDFYRKLSTTSPQDFNVFADGIDSLQRIVMSRAVREEIVGEGFRYILGTFERKKPQVRG